MKFVQVFTGLDSEEAVNKANQWVYGNGLTNVDYQYQLTTSEFDGEPYETHSIMVVYEAVQPIPQEKAAETEESQEPEIVPAAAEYDDLPY